MRGAVCPQLPRPSSPPWGGPNSQQYWGHLFKSPPPLPPLLALWPVELGKPWQEGGNPSLSPPTAGGDASGACHTTVPALLSSHHIPLSPGRGLAQPTQPVPTAMLPGSGGGQNRAMSASPGTLGLPEDSCQPPSGLSAAQAEGLSPGKDRAQAEPRHLHLKKKFQQLLIFIKNYAGIYLISWQAINKN